MGDRRDKMLKLSIIIPVYKVAEFIASTVQSLLCQHDPAVEYIFVNDGTPDASWQILQDTLQKYPECTAACKLIQLPENGGVENARMTGLAQAAGEYIWFVDSDDLIAEGAIKAVLLTLQKNPVDYLAIRFQTLQPEEKIHPLDKNFAISQLPVSELVSAILSYTGSFQAAWGNIVKRQLTVDHPMQKTNLKIAEDYVMHCCWSIFAESAAVLETPVYGYVIRPQSAMNQSQNQDVMKATKQAFQKLSEFSKILPEKKQQLFCSKLQFTAAKMRMLFFIDILNNHDRSEFKELMQYQVEAKYSLLKDIWKLPLELQPIMFCDRLKCYGIMRCYTITARKLKQLFYRG